MKWIKYQEGVQAVRIHPWNAGQNFSRGFILEDGTDWTKSQTVDQTSGLLCAQKSYLIVHQALPTTKQLTMSQIFPEIHLPGGFLIYRRRTRRATGRNGSGRCN